MSTKVKHKPAKKIKKSDNALATKSNAETRKFLEKLIGGRLSLGDAIRNTRECDEMSQVNFAKKLGVSKSYLSDLENDRKEVSPKKAAEFARILEDSEAQFVRLAIQDMLIRQGLHYTIELHKAA